MKSKTVIFVIFSFYVQCVIWSVGACLTEKDQDKFSDAIKSLSQNGFVDEKGLPVKSLFDHFYDPQHHKWISWTKYVPRYVHDSDMPYDQILVPTEDTVKRSHILSKLIAAHKPILFVGNAGTSKSVTIGKYVSSLPRESNIILNLNFSSRTTSMDIQRCLEGNIEKRTKDVFGPV